MEKKENHAWQPLCSLMIFVCAAVFALLSRYLFFFSLSMLFTTSRPRRARRAPTRSARGAKSSLNSGVSNGGEFSIPLLAVRSLEAENRRVVAEAAVVSAEEARKLAEEETLAAQVRGFALPYYHRNDLEYTFFQTDFQNFCNKYSDNFCVGSGATGGRLLQKRKKENFFCNL